MSNTVQNARIESTRGASYAFAMDYLEDDEVTPVDLTGCTARLQVRGKTGGIFGTFDLSINVSTGRISRTLTPSETRAIPEGMQTWGAEILFPSGAIEPIGPGLEWRSLPEAVK